MRRIAIVLAGAGALLAATSANGSPVADIVEGHVQQGFTRLAVASGDLRAVAREECDPESERLRRAYHSAFDAWIAVSHLRFGPSETENRAFALAFWPDSRGRTPRALGRMIDGEDRAGRSPEKFREVSVAARGFFALEFLLFDSATRAKGTSAYRCALLRTQTVDVERIAEEILGDWQSIHAVLVGQPSGDGAPDWGEEELLRKLFYFSVDGSPVHVGSAARASSGVPRTSTPQAGRGSAVVAVQAECGDKPALPPGVGGRVGWRP